MFQAIGASNASTENTLQLNDVMTVLKENERMMREYDGGPQILIVAENGER